uniref:DUF262 domain-containing protein n=1 Tax=viral metagenome TaxID=1070528 RepID=A0A6C0D4U5_9ZZZZ
MTGKQVTSAVWSVSFVVDKIDSNEMRKPHFQRKKKWLVQPKDSTPNEHDFILFLYEIKHSVDAITFGKRIVSDKVYYTNIDGNNRLNALHHYMKTPFDIFPKKLDNIILFFKSINTLSHDEIHIIIKSIQETTYTTIICYRRAINFFATLGLSELYDKKLQSYGYAIDDEMQQIKDSILVDGKDFSEVVKINVNLFEGYNEEELNKVFADTNKYKCSLTETELLASCLYDVKDFIILDSTIRMEIRKNIQQYYIDKSKGEALSCFEFGDDEDINAHDFVVGFQNYCAGKYSIIEKVDTKGLSLFFKLYKTMNNGFGGKFTTDNINRFIDDMNNACILLQRIIDKIFSQQVNSKLFNATCEKKVTTLKKNNIYIILSSIIGFINKGILDSYIINIIEKTLLYHFFCSDVHDKIKREQYSIHDKIRYIAGGAYIDGVAKHMISNPELICTITEENMKSIIATLCDESVHEYDRTLENGNKKKDKRRDRKFFEKTLFLYYYKSKVPVNLLNNTFWLEHILPFSSTWNNQIDIDRLGNVVPIIDEINIKRGNKHINEYVKIDKDGKFIRFIDVIPSDSDYNNIIDHTPRTPHIIDNEKYNQLCTNNEAIYINNFIQQMFP